MKIEIVWNQPGGTVAALPPFTVNPNDPHKDDEELQIAKAKWRLLKRTCTNSLGVLHHLTSFRLQ